MAPTKARFDFRLFWHAMISLLGREPDHRRLHGWDGVYTFRYEPRDEGERTRFARDVVVLQEWLGIFDLTAIESHCDYGRLVHPRPDEEGKDYLDIKIVHHVEKNAGDC